MVGLGVVTQSLYPSLRAGNARKQSFVERGERALGHVQLRLRVLSLVPRKSQLPKFLPGDT